MAQVIGKIPLNLKSNAGEVLIATIKPSLSQAWPRWVLGVVYLSGAIVILNSMFSSIDMAAYQIAAFLPIHLPGSIQKPLIVAAVVCVSFWHPAIYTWKLAATKYEITSRRILYTWGILNRHHDQVELVRVRDIRVTRPLWLRLIRQGSVELTTVDRRFQELAITGLHEPLAVKSLVHELNHIERERLGYMEVEASQYIR